MEPSRALFISLQVLALSFALWQVVGFGIVEYNMRAEFVLEKYNPQFAPLRLAEIWESAFRLISFRFGYLFLIWTLVPISLSYVVSSRNRRAIVLCLLVLVLATLFHFGRQLVVMFGIHQTIAASISFSLPFTAGIILSGLIASIMLLAPLGLTVAIARRRGWWWAVLCCLVILASWAIGHYLMLGIVSFQASGPVSETGLVSISRTLGLLVWGVSLLVVISMRGTFDQRA